MPASAVWHALTDAEELMRWFPPLARVEPGVGGSMFMSRNWPWPEMRSVRTQKLTAHDGDSATAEPHAVAVQLHAYHSAAP